MSIEDELDAPRTESTAWRPEAGDKLIGVVVDVGSYDGGYGLYPIIVVQNDMGDNLAFHAMHTVAKEEVNKLAPQVGDDFGVKYEGKIAGKNGGNSYESFRIVCKRAAKTEEPF